MSLDSFSRHPVSLELAASIARERFGIVGDPERLPGEHDDNFRVKGCGGDFVLKVMHPGRERAFVETIGGAHRHVTKVAPDLGLAPVVEARDGGWLVTTRDESDAERAVWMLRYTHGRPLASVNPRTPALHRDLGAFLGRLDRALEDYRAERTERGRFEWDLANAAWIGDHLERIEDSARRRLVDRFLARFREATLPVMAGLPRAVIHGDANDHNVIVSYEPGEPGRIASVIDFGDIHRTARVCEPAVAAAYALLDAPDPLAVLRDVVAGYHAVSPLREDEIEVVFSLVSMRLCVSVVKSAIRRVSRPGDPYLSISEAPAWRALEKLATIDPRYARLALRASCGIRPIVPGSERVSSWLAQNADRLEPVLPFDLRCEPIVVLDLSVGSLELGADPGAQSAAAISRLVASERARTGAVAAIGRYDEARLLYSAPLFAGATGDDERRTIHLGIDVFIEEATPVSAPLAGVVRAVADRQGEQDYGGVVVLEHVVEDGVRFFTLYGHLAPSSIEGLAPGRRIGQGEVFARIGGEHENGGWTPHLHLQLFLEDFDRAADLPGVARESDRELWIAISPDPNSILRIPAGRFPTERRDRDDLFTARRTRLLRNLSVAYRDPPVIVRGWKTRLYDATGREYLDVFNNVPLVGHSHPRVVAAAARQLRLLNTNTRYLHENVVRYAERLTAKLPPELSVCAFVNSASEANELALRLARAHTKRNDVIVLEHAYHGNTKTLIDVSPYKFDGPGGRGRRPWVHVAPLPDDYRGRLRRGEPNLGRRYAEFVTDLAAAHEETLAAFLAETLPSVGGQVVLPDGYLRNAYEAVRAHGGVCIADEVQVGFGRLGSCFFGFESQGVVPDIVVLGKPIGNGFPLAAVVTTRAIADSFSDGMEFFSTFGGNPVACAAGLAVLDVLEEEALQRNAAEVGAELKSGLHELSMRYELVGDVRGLGLFLGMQLVSDRTTRAPAGAEAGYVVERLRERGILCGTDGPHHDVLKIRPPLCFSRTEAMRLVETLGDILAEDPLRHRSAFLT